jgi:hypothetical protein
MISLLLQLAWYSPWKKTILGNQFKQHVTAQIQQVAAAEKIIRSEFLFYYLLKKTEIAGIKKTTSACKSADSFTLDPWTFNCLPTENTNIFARKINWIDWWSQWHNASFKLSTS